ncbi:hypothetical protein [Oscillibacter sp.]|uniref:hypothetical protein n=1 Tax=Oscillibacter sp. TaxID=1945593 RepID=UPI00339120C6
MGEKLLENQYRDTLVCIDSCADGVYTGRLINLGLPKPIMFHGVMQFLLEVEELLDDMRFPEPFVQTRSFAMTAKPPANTAQDTAHGCLATFNLRVLFRQNASWQGSVQWLEGRQEESFRSALELLLLMNSTMNLTNEHT